MAGADRDWVCETVSVFCTGLRPEDFGLIDKNAKPKQQSRATILSMPVQKTETVSQTQSRSAPAKIFELYPEAPQQENSNGNGKYMSWKGMHDEALIQHALDIMKVNEQDIPSLTKLRQSQFSNVWEVLRGRGLLFVVKDRLEKMKENNLRRMGIKFFNLTEDDEIHMGLLSDEKLLTKVRKMHVKSVDELLRYKPLCKLLQERGLLLTVMGWLTPEATVSTDKNSGNAKKNSGSKSKGSSNIIELSAPTHKKGKGNGKKKAA